MNKIELYPEKTMHSLGDLWGIFFEDINHAADGGLYAEMVQNRSFEFDKIDNWQYNPLTAWEKVGNCDAEVLNEYPLNRNNTHYLTLKVGDEKCGIKNLGFNDGMNIIKGEEYRFSFYARRNTGFNREVEIILTDKNTKAEIACNSLKIKSCDWGKYECTLTAKESGTCELSILTSGRSMVYIDDVSLFPPTFKNRENGMRRDLAQLLADLKPKFMRFPGGCLVHDGNLDPHARNALYRWKNTLGDVSERPTRRSNWGYNQTLGLGYYEYFCFCEDIGAKPLPVLPAAYNPHRRDAVPFDELKPWIDDALDLIEFANGSPDTKWGGLRCRLGHEKPFGLEYLAIGNEEVGDDFFERYPYFHNAIKAKYPEIKLIGSSGPFPCGGEFEKGWRCAEENKSEMVDEHYYVSPEWMLANTDRYFKYDKHKPKVFLGEYASWGNTLYNALCEAAYMTGIEMSGNVALACYAPLLCNSDYINWKPDMIWFNGKDAYATANYYVQKLFMNYMGKCAIEHSVFSQDAPKVIDNTVCGEIQFETTDTAAQFFDITLNSERVKQNSFTLKRNGTQVKKLEECGRLRDFTIECKAKELDGIRGFTIRFGINENICYRWEFGGWQNQDSALCSHTNNREAVLDHRCRSVECGRTYDLKVVVEGHRIRCFIDGEIVHDVTVKDTTIENLYTSVTKDENNNIILKGVNVSENPYVAEINVNREIKSVEAYVLSGSYEDENSFENPKKVVPLKEDVCFENEIITHEFPPHSVTVMIIK